MDYLRRNLIYSVYLGFMAGQWFSPGTPVSSTNKTDCHDITELLLKMALNTIFLTLYLNLLILYFSVQIYI
jgi:hypothetical protein